MGRKVEGRLIDRLPYAFFFELPFPSTSTTLPLVVQTPIQLYQLFVQASFFSSDYRSFSDLLPSRTRRKPTRPPCWWSLLPFSPFFLSSPFASLPLSLPTDISESGIDRRGTFLGESSSQLQLRPQPPFSRLQF